MKKVLLIAAIAVCSFGASAQTEAGNAIVGGAVNFTSDKAEGADEAATSFQIVPQVGYFIQNDLAIGAGIGYMGSKDSDGSKQSAFVLAPFGRYYKSISEQFKFFGQLAVPMAFGSSEDEDGNDLGKINSVGVSLSPGFAFFPAKKFGIELGFDGISYQSTTTKPEGLAKSTNNSFSIGADFFNPTLGLFFYF